MKSSVDLNSFDVWSLFGPIALGSAVVIVPFSLIMGLLSFMGAPTVSVTGEYIYGIGAMFVALLIGVLLPGVMAFNICLYASLALWLYRRVLVRSGAAATTAIS